MLSRCGIREAYRKGEGGWDMHADLLHSGLPTNSYGGRSTDMFHRERDGMMVAWLLSICATGDDA